jgi:hypothetical protein
MIKRKYRTTFEGQLYECQAQTKSEARGIFKKMTAKQVGNTKEGGRVFALKSRLKAKVKVCKNV